MTDEPYRWLEAVANRREYIRDQLKGATPVFAFSRPEGIVLFGVGTGQSKVFEIYDRQALAALGHPVDIEKIRQSLIETAHVEGFTRAPEDVTVRRLLNFSLGPALKTGFEQIFSAPLLLECVVAEVGATEAGDTLARVSFDGSYRFESGGVAVVHTQPEAEAAAAAWLRARLGAEASLEAVGRMALTAWKTLSEGRTDFPDSVPESSPLAVEGRTIEWALLDRKASGRVRYRPLAPALLS